MKEVIALILTLIVGGVGIYCLIKKEPIGIGRGILILGFAIAVGFAVANYDVIKKFTWKGSGIEIETAMREIESVKSRALEEMAREVETHKESIKMLIAYANSVREQLDKQRRLAEELLAQIDRTKSEVEDQRERLEELNAISKDLTLTYTKVVWLQSQSHYEIGTDRDMAAKQEIENELKRLLPIVFPDPTERDSWIQKLEGKLPPPYFSD